MYTGVIIEESLENKDVLKEVRIIATRIKRVTKNHKTPWIKQWTLRTVEIPENKAQRVAEKISAALDSQHALAWYADFKNDTTHFIIFYNKIFIVNRTSRKQYDEATNYGLSLGVPDYQLDFSPKIKERTD